MKNLSKKLVLVVVLVLGIIVLNSCTDNTEQIEEINQNELQLIDKGELEGQPDEDEETGDE